MKQITKQTLLPFIKDFLPDNPVIVEAGAFNGGDTQTIAAFWPAGTVHAFEPVPDIFALLVKNTATWTNVHRYNLALSHTTGSATFYVSESPKKVGQPFQAGSLLKPKKRLELSPVQYNRTITVPTITLDEWATQQQISHVDFLWLDIQGHGLAVLQASPHILRTLRVLYIELEFVEAYEGQAQYQETRDWLESQGFGMVARDFGDTPTWFFGNGVFVRQAPC